MMTSPYLRPKNNRVSIIMLDVILALLPLVLVSYIAYGMLALKLVLIAVGTALLSDALFSYLLLGRKTTVFDGSAIITALLLTFTLSPLTPWYVVAFGSAMAILFGKIAWGGIGKNRFNPALVGREFMTLFFPSIMTSATLWMTKGLVQTPAPVFFDGSQSDAINSAVNAMLYKTTGALGEYSIALILLGGAYLIWRRRISWHIPFALLTVFSAMFWIVPTAASLPYSMAGVLLGAIFMATDMPSSPTNVEGKLYYGGMIGLTAFIFIAGNVRYEYLSYAILLLNGFSPSIARVFRPTVWGEVRDWKKKLEETFLLTLSILGAALAILSLYYYEMMSILLYVYIVYIIIKFNLSFQQKLHNPL